MKEGKLYRFNPIHRDSFIDMNTSNENMVKIIENHGGTFKVLVARLYGIDEFVTKVQFIDGTILSDVSDPYFEIGSDEFFCFEEVSECKIPEGGPLSLTLEVTKYNAEEMIELIKKVFN